MFLNIIIFLRWKDWTKNLIIFFPYIFNENISGFRYFIDLFIVFIAFSTLCSIVYIINDAVDLESDKKHDLKRHLKPLANGKITTKFAKILLMILITVLLSLIFFANLYYIHFLGYFIIMLAYIFLIKKVIILDILLVSFGYLIRLDLGSTVIDVSSSINLLACVLTLVMFVLFIKRYSEFISQNKVRTSLIFYNSSLLKFFIISSAIFFILFSIYFIYFEKIILIIILPFLIYNLFRYYKISITKNLGEFPIEVVIKDKILLINTFFILIIILVLFF